MENETQSLAFSQHTDIIKEYEVYIKQLMYQIHISKDEHIAFKEEITGLLQENNTLACKLNECMQTNVDAEPRRYSEDDFTNNLRLQLNLALKEKESISDLWQSSLKTIDHLEEELKLFEGRNHGYISKQELNTLKEAYEKQVKDVQLELLHTQKSLQDEAHTTKTKLKTKTEALEKAFEEHKHTLTLVRNLESDLKVMQEKQMNVIVFRNNLQKTIKDKDETIEQLKCKQLELKTKVFEALQLVEAAIVEKDSALLRERQTKEEIDKLSKIMAEIVDETSEKVKNEVELIETKHKIKLRKAMLDLDHLKEELISKNEEISKYKKDCKLLEEQLERVQKGNIHLDGSNTSKLLILEKNLESTFQKLLISEKKNQQLMAEKDSIKSDLEQMGDYYERDIKLRDAEKTTFESKIKALQKELQSSNVNLLHLAAQVNELNATIQHMESDIKKQISFKDRASQKHLSERVSAIQSANEKIQVELRRQLESHLQINKKWKHEVREITNKLEKRIKELRSETTDLKKINKHLTVKLSGTELKLSEYKQCLEKLCAGVNKAVECS